MRVELEGKTFQNSLEVINGLVNEAVFKFTPQGVQLCSMDPANVAMIIFKMDKDEFRKFDVKEEVAVGVNVANLKQFLKRGKDKDIISMELKDSQIDVGINGEVKKKFVLPLIDIDESKAKKPELDFKTTIRMKSADLKSAVEDVAIVAEACSFELGDSGLTIAGKGDLMKADIGCIYDAKKEEKQKSLYSIEYLQKILAASKIAEDVEVSWNKDYPAQFRFGGTMEFILAPRVEN